MTDSGPSDAVASDAVASEPLISVRSLSKSFEGPGGRPLPVLDNINLDVAEGEFVALLGRSGSGKSTLLRCIAGLMAPTKGQVLFRGAALTGSNRDTTMVFQTFALMPWLTVQQNVELGLEARGVAPAQRSERALRAIDLVGLDGYESAYPKELSGGMRQRVGFARALVVEPAALLMDEPFSALDVLTSENLRGELLELWEGQRFPTKTMVMVTHNIEEAVLLADRILVLGTNPGRIRSDLRNPLPRPRRRRTPEFEELVDQIYRMMTQREAAPAAAPAGRGGRGTVSDTPLPPATVDGLSGLAEVMLGRHGGAADLADLADSLGLEVDDLLPLVDALLLLGFAELHDDRLELSAAGRVFAGASIQDSKQIFARASLDHAPLVRTIYRALRGSLDGNLPAGFFTDILRTSFSEEDSARQLDVAVNWGRYAELYAFDAARGLIIREDEGIGAALADDVQVARRGALVVYLGAAPGSGKTFTMLREGRALRSQGEDVVIGYVETRGRPRTIEAIGGLEIVPPLADSGDLDTGAVLARKPAVVLVDDLGRHVGAIGALRYAGMDVISTADVADVQRVAAAVREITGRAPTASVSDEMLADADEVQFVDSSPEALRKRLGHGNIYPPDQVSAALASEFQTPRLAALRELGLRLIADTLPAPAGARAREPQDVLVVVSDPDRAEALAAHGVRLARRGSARCSVLLLGPAPRRAAAAVAIRRSATAADAREIERTGDAATVIPQSVRETGARHLVLAARPPRPLDRLRGSAIERLLVQLPDVDLHILTGAPGGGAPGTQGAGAMPGAKTGAGAGLAARPPRAPIRIYLGYARGCGTTTAMLEEAVRRRSRGADVVVAAVEARGREEVSVLLDGLEQIGDGTSLDTDAVLARRPEVVCLDEVSAMTITGESRLVAARRLADAGIAVVATAHLGGVLDEASLLALADEIELVDVTPSALIDRVRRGEIVPPAQIEPAQIEQALATDYAPAGLTEQREHAFRIVAEHGERRLAAYRQDDPRAVGAQARPGILACVAPRPGMEQLIRRSAALAAQVDGEFRAATVADAGPGGDEAALVSAYSALVARLGGELAVLTGASPAAALAEYALRHRTSEMVLARNDNNRPGRYPVLRELTRRAADLELHVLPAEPAG
ncbi:MAG TPA: AAA-associated domain-containing protein [Streptosporangiaceae bacterium]|nr:AAA-associated domain-containing protein [Streptosporangiaceae bacterium]